MSKGKHTLKGHLQQCLSKTCNQIKFHPNVPVNCRYKLLSFALSFAQWKSNSIFARKKFREKFSQEWSTCVQQPNNNLKKTQHNRQIHGREIRFQCAYWLWISLIRVILINSWRLLTECLFGTVAKTLIKQCYYNWQCKVSWRLMWWQIMITLMFCLSWTHRDIPLIKYLSKNNERPTKS